MKLKEDRVHGSHEYPYEQYYMRDIQQPFQIPVHWHEEIEIIYIEAGVLQVKIGDQEYEGRSGDIFFVNTGELHLMGAEKPGVQYYTILFPMDFISFQTADDLENKLMAPLRHQQLLFPDYIDDAAEREKIGRLLQELTKVNLYKEDLIKQDCETENLILQLRTRMLLLELFQYLCERGCFIESEFQRNSDLKREMLMYIQEHFRERITLGMLAEEFHLSEKYVSRYFVENFHIPFSNYVVHLRLKEARKLLEMTELPVTEIGLTIGFSNVSYFIRSFKEAYGASPLKYRRLTEK